MRNEEFIRELFKIKLELADRAVSLLPGPIRAAARELENGLFTAVRDALGEHLQKQPEPAKQGGLKKIELE